MVALSVGFWLVGKMAGAFWEWVKSKIG